MIAIAKIAENLQLDTPNKEEVQEILIEFDENKDGVLQYEEFEKLILELFKKHLMNVNKYYNCKSFM